jgi:hypothetical protein
VREIVDIPEAADAPSRDSALASQGIPEGAEVPDRIERLAQAALDLYIELAEPRGIRAEVSLSEFDEIYRGDGLNEAHTPLEAIAPRADRLALFALTLGEPVSRKIRGLFDANDPALAAMLDGIASERADAAARFLASDYYRKVVAGGASPDVRVLAYSPGYCGWHVTGQRRLFGRLHPEEIGITLNASCLMSPLKSVSGILVAGRASVHEFDDDFDFCHDCSTRDCRERIASIAVAPRENGNQGGPGWRS